MVPTRPLSALPETHALFARDDWPHVRKVTKALAYKVRPNLGEAKDLAHAAILRCLDHPKEPWRLTTGQLIKWLGRCVAFISFHWRRHDEGFPHDPIAQEGGSDELDDGTSYTLGHILEAPGPSPESAYAAVQAEAIYRKRLDLLGQKVADDALVSLLVAEVARKAESPKDAAIAKGFSADDVYNARKRLERAAIEVIEDERKAQALAQAQPPSQELR
jgi:hypothetical protein